MTRSAQHKSDLSDREKKLKKKQVQVALLLHLNDIQPWQYRLAEQIEEDENLRLCCILNTTGRMAVRKALASKAVQLLERIEKRLFLPKRLTNAEAPTHQIRAITAQDISLENIYSDDALTALSGSDVVVSLVPITEELASAIAEHSVLWSIAAGNCTGTNQPQFGFREMFKRDGTSALALLKKTTGGSKLLAKSTVQQQFCYARNKRFLLEKSVPLILRELRRTANHDHRQTETIETYSGRADDYAGIGDILAYIIRLATNLVPKVYKALLRKTGRRFNRWSLFVGTGDFDPQRMSWAVETHPPANEFWADPFLFSRAGDQELLVFFENFEFSTGLGKISVGRLDASKVVYLGDALVRPYHLSYPFVYTYRGDIYMIPETAKSRQIEIWKAKNFPLEWTLHKTVLQGQSCADTTIVEHDGAWWMFTSISLDSFDDHCSELHVFKVDSPLLNRIEPHELNPVITDARTARNAGRIAVRDGKLTRLAQNNAYHYGYGFSLMEIECLSVREYHEKCLYSVKPDFAPGIGSTHHMDQLDNVHIFDGLREFG
ncbi:MAG: hypothetical protein HKN11_09735 [Rhizobiales bacterium]|nr:hypothetical protein [Hyphomicrobiales bacterium]